jgi:hypothetical protein
MLGGRSTVTASWYLMPSSTEDTGVSESARITWRRILAWSASSCSRWFPCCSWRSSSRAIDLGRWSSLPPRTSKWGRAQRTCRSGTARRSCSPRSSHPGSLARCGKRRAGASRRSRPEVWRARAISSQLRPSTSASSRVMRLGCRAGSLASLQLGSAQASSATTAGGSAFPRRTRALDPARAPPAGLAYRRHTPALHTAPRWGRCRSRRRRRAP